MRVERRNGYRLIIGAPLPPQADAMTLGKWILVRKESAGSRGLLAHELVHVRQFGRLGPTRFTARYLASYLRYRLAGYGHMGAYRRIPLEVEASWLSRIHSLEDLEPGPDARAHTRSGRRSARRNTAEPRPVPSGVRNRPRSATPRAATSR